MTTFSFSLMTTSGVTPKYLVHDAGLAVNMRPWPPCRRAVHVPSQHSLAELPLGKPKEFAKPDDSGAPITRFFCGDCGSVHFRQTLNMPGQRMSSAAMVDDEKWIDTHPLIREVMINRKPGWLPEICADARYEKDHKVDCGCAMRLRGSE